MSKISRCPRCGGNIVEPAFPGDGDYPVQPMCSCNEAKDAEPSRRRRRYEDDDDER
jgi:hypothetical protein